MIYWIFKNLFERTFALILARITDCQMTKRFHLPFQILQMLCQILQTDDVNAVQSWLVSAGDRGELT